TPQFRPNRQRRQPSSRQRARNDRSLPHWCVPHLARPDGFARNPFYQRGTFNVDLRITKGFAWWPDHGLFLFGIGIYNLTNHTNPLRVSPYHGLPTYRGLIETLNARQTQFSFQWEF